MDIISKRALHSGQQQAIQPGKSTHAARPRSFIVLIIAMTANVHIRIATCMIINLTNEMRVMKVKLEGIGAMRLLDYLWMLLLLMMTRDRDCALLIRYIVCLGLHSDYCTFTHCM